MIMAYWKLILLTLAITELVKDDFVKNKKTLPWLAVGISVVVSLIYVWISSGWVLNAMVWPALVRGLTSGLIATGIYKLLKDYYRAMKK